MAPRGPAQRHSWQVACLGLPELLRFLNTVALACATWRYTRGEWKNYEDSAVLNAVYAVFFWKGKPGTVEVVQNENMIRDYQERLLAEYLDQFLTRSETDPNGAIAYLEDLSRRKAFALQAVQEIFADARRINREVIGETTTAIRDLARIKLASTLVLTGMSVGIGLAAAGGLGAAAKLAIHADRVVLGYEVMGEVVQGLNSSKPVNAVAIDIATNVLGHLLEKSLPHIQRAAKGIGASQGSIASVAKRRIEWMSERLGGELSGRKVGQYTRRIERATGEMNRAATTAARARFVERTAGIADKVVPVISAGKDVLDAVAEYEKDTAVPRRSPETRGP